MTETILTPRPGVHIAYQRHEGGADLPGAMFMGGFRSDMTGTKATFLEGHCMARDQAFVRFDYRGHGLSSGIFEDLDLHDWLHDSLDVLDRLTMGEQIVIGSSMGGWLALHVALRRPERVKGLILLAPAPDFTEDVLALLSPEQHKELAATGTVHLPSAYGDPYPLTQKLFDSGKNLLLLKDDIPLHCPVRILHGKQDSDVPWQRGAMTLERLQSADKKAVWIEDGDHRLSREQDLALLDRTLKELAGL